ncbi:hypothetical protein ALQ08_200266 [Pseudomonas syringae pv. delphinii]|nr:hypothetical protein ALQ08_200266 [Pseudomonas syringae pv. delphinii]
MYGAQALLNGLGLFGAVYDGAAVGAKGTGTGKAPYTSTVSPDAEAGMPYAHPVKEAGPKGAGTSLERGLAYDNPSNLVQNRVSEIQSQIPANSQGRITMGVAVVEDANGVRSVLVSTSEPRGYLRPGVSLQEGEKVVVGTGHAEADIVSYASANGLKVVDIGATRPVCASCQNVIEPTGANVSTPLKPLPKAKQ